MADGQHSMSAPYLVPAYGSEDEIPFAPDGNAPLIAGYVEKVKGVSDGFRGLKCARKTVPIPSEADTPLLRQRLFNEAKTLSLARHCHVVTLIHTYLDETDTEQLKFAIIMDRAEGSLQQYLKPDSGLDWAWFGCLISAIAHVHALGIRHRDIKPSNVLIKNGMILLADFGISHMGLGQTMPTTYQDRRPARTKQYCAPEVDRGSTRGRSADIFSLGAVMLEMLVALDEPSHWREMEKVLRPSPGSVASYSEHINALHSWIANCFHPPGWQGELLAVCRQMLDVDRDARPTALDIQHSWSSMSLPDDSMICKCSRSESPTAQEHLIKACISGNASHVRNLLEQMTDPWKAEGIHFAATHGSVPTVQAFLDVGVSVDAQNPVGQTALQCAARNGHVGVAEQLIRNHADVNLKDENEQTALHGAAAHGHKSMVELLLATHVDVTAEDLDGHTARYFASMRHHTDIEAMLHDAEDH